CHGKRVLVCGITTRSNPESSNSRPCAPCAKVLLYRQFRLMGNTIRPSLLVAAGWPAKVAGARVTPAITALVFFRKSRRSMVFLFPAEVLKKRADRFVARILAG